MPDTGFPLSYLHPSRPATSHTPQLRLKSQDILQQQREIEIDHLGKIYRLRVTLQNKLILTA